MAWRSFLDAVASPPVLDVEQATFHTDTGQVTTSNGDITIPSFSAANGNGPSIRVFVVRSAHIKDAIATSSADPASGNAIAIVASEAITIEGRLRVEGAAGGMKETGCAGGVGRYYEDTDGEPVRTSGSGGGGHATPGGRGGNLGTMYLGGARGEMSGTESLIPLRGGCPAGGVQLDSGTNLYGTAGGGAIQLVSRTEIIIAGIVDARGASGDGQERCGLAGTCVGGGGGGGGILIEAPRVRLDPHSALIVKGGSGAGPGCEYASGDDSAGPSLPTPCVVSGGQGASTTASATDGAGFATNPVRNYVGSGGGGGGVGRIRINTPTATYIKDSSVVEAGLVTTGLLGTR